MSGPGEWQNLAPICRVEIEKTQKSLHLSTMGKGQSCRRSLRDPICRASAVDHGISTQREAARRHPHQLGLVRNVDALHRLDPIRPTTACMDVCLVDIQKRSSQ